MTPPKRRATLPGSDLVRPRPEPFPSVDPEQLGLARLFGQQLSDRLMRELEIGPAAVAAALAETAATLMLRCGGEFAVRQLLHALLLSLDESLES